MRYIRAFFKNYIGFYNGLGLYEVDIDFSKCKNRIISIGGGNGRGKSTLMNHLNPFPDGSNSFIPDKTAEKILVLFHEGDTYNIRIISPADAKGRKTTKAYIQKNGVELNENGNVSSYKDTIFTEFELDSNYISLSRLSSTDRGLGDKTPAERKKFTANIIDNLEIYNNMYKTLNKKSLIYKSHINTLHTKIQNIGDKATLDQRLSILKNKETELDQNILNLNNQIVAINTKFSIDESEAKIIKDATELVDTLKNKLDSIQIELDKMYNKTKIKKEEIIEKYENDKQLISSYTSKVNELSLLHRTKSDRLAEVSTNISSIEAELNNIDNDNDISDRYNSSNNKIKDLKLELSKLNIKADTNLILSLTNTISFCDKIIQMIDNLMEDMSPSDVKFLIETYSKKYIDSLMIKQREIMSEIENNNLEIIQLQSDIKLLATLEDRPNNCKIDNCPFISSALKLKKSIKEDPIELLSNSQDRNLKLSDNITEIQSEIDFCSQLSSKKMKLDLIRSTILENSDNLAVFYPDFINTFDDRLVSLNSFSEIRDHSNLIEGLNLLKILDSEINTNKVLEVEYKGYREKIQLLNSSKSMLEKLQKEQLDLITEVRDLKSDIDKYNKTLSDVNSIISNEAIYSNLITEYDNVFVEFTVAQNKVNEFNDKSAKALESLSVISSLKNQIEDANKELQPISKEISLLTGQLTLLNTYYLEFNEYKSSYDLIETLKKYCSPTGGGIQTLFMQIYMSKTKQTANEILAMMFNGSYQLLDFIINENEFRIPFIGEGLPVDDISSGSGAQISMMSMIINLVLLHQASTKFNIAQLDELTSNLDAYNNSIFSNVLLHCINILSLEQVFIISHAIEIDDGIADIVYLGGLDDYFSKSNKNIIWDYDTIIQQ